MPNATDLAGARAIVTGASRGIGNAIAVDLAARGADVALVQRGEAEETVAAIEALGRRAVVVRADLGDAHRAAEAVDEAADTLGGLDVLVCNAGMIQRSPALDADLDEWRRVIDVNLVSVFAASRAAARRFVSQGSGGAIVAIASVLSFQGGLRVSAYAASKGGIAQLVKALAVEWAPLDIRVNAVAPGYVETELNEVLLADPIRTAEISARIPAGRWASGEDIAGAVAFLASPESAYVNGAVLPVDGGWLAR